MTTAILPEAGLATILPFPLQPASAIQLIAQRFGGVVALPSAKCDLRIEIPSRTVPGQNYVLSHNRDGHWFFTCKGCRYGWMQRELPCKHMQDMVPALRLALELEEMTAIPPPDGVWY